MKVKIYFDTEKALMMEDAKMNILAYVTDEISEGRHSNAIVVDAESGKMVYEIWDW